MDDVKRKKKNKKNKGKLTKAADGVVAGSVESPQTEQEVNHESAPGQNKQETDVGTMHVGNKGKTVDATILVTGEPTQNGLDGSDVNSETDIEQNHQDPDTGITSAQSILDVDSRKLERHRIKESDFMEQREMLKGLQNNMVSCIEKEFILGEKIELLQNENESFIKKENIWNLKLEQLHSEMHCCSLKEADLENRLICLEKGNESRISKESLIGQIVVKLEEANTGLQKQVKELEISKGNLVQENQQLANCIALLEARVEQLDSETASFRSLTEMMNKVDLKNDIGKDPTVAHVSSTRSLPPDKIISEPTDKLESSGASFETINIADADVNVVDNGGIHPEDSTLFDESKGGTAIAQIPLDDNRAHRDKSREENGEMVVPFSDAPLIGAPFRLVSFVASYVSGADLVRENRHNSGR